MIIAEIYNPGDAVVFTDGLVKRGVKSGWVYTVRVRGVEMFGYQPIAKNGYYLNLKKKWTTHPFWYPVPTGI